MLLSVSCKKEGPKDVSDSQETNILGIKDYDQILRHPVSMDDLIDSADWAQIEFVNLISDFDTIEAGLKTSHEFEYHNIGDNALYILDTKVSCGCTIVEFDEKPLLPKEKGKLLVEFDSAGKSGNQERSIIVISNSYPNETILKIKGFIKS